MQLGKEAQVRKKFQAKMGLEYMSCKIVLHSALPSELSSSEGWTNLNSVLYH